MPRKCAVRGCTSNYKPQKAPCVSTFCFPKDTEMRKLWLKCINRQDLNVTKNSTVCIKHFPDSQIIRIDTMPTHDGGILSVRRKIPKLVKDAYPSIIPIQYESQNSVSSKRKRKRQENLYKECNHNDEIYSFSDFCLKFKEKYLLDFDYKIHSDEHVLFYQIDMNKYYPTISYAFKVFNTLEIEVFHYNSLLPTSKFRSIFGSQLLCNKWCKFEHLIRYLNNLALGNESWNEPSFGIKKVATSKKKKKEIVTDTTNSNLPLVPDVKNENPENEEFEFPINMQYYYDIPIEEVKIED